MMMLGTVRHKRYNESPADIVKFDVNNSIPRCTSIYSSFSGRVRPATFSAYDISTILVYMSCIITDIIVAVGQHIERILDV